VIALYVPYLIPLGLALFVLRSQLLRVALLQAEGDLSKVHASALLGATSGWASLIGALALLASAFIVNGLWRGGISVILGVAMGILMSALFLPMLGNTLAMGHHGGEGNTSIAAFNRRYGHIIAFAVGWIAFICLYSIFSPS
jgi:hypothetical protein